MKKRLLCLLMCCCLPLLYPAFARGEARLRVVCKRSIVSYAKNTLLVSAPEEGELTVTLRDGDTLYREMTFCVQAGESSISWDGLAFHQERLRKKTYQLQSTLAGKSGKIWTHTANATADYSAQALIYALPSADTLYLDHADEWFIEAKTVLSGTVVVELVPDGAEEPSHAFRKNVAAGKYLKLVFSTLAGKTLPSPGVYTVRVYEVSNKNYCASFPVTVEAEKPADPPITITGPILPERGASDAEIWAVMRQPSVVVDIDSFEHQTVYEQPDAASGALGTLHGQTQALQVLEIVGDWARIGAWNHEEAEYVEGYVPMSVLKWAEPQGDYGLLLDKQAQTLTIYYKGEKLDTLLVSTGHMEKGQLDQETTAGAFLTGLHRSDFSTNGQKFDHVIQYDGGNLLHQIPYAWGGGKQDFTEGRSYLGSKASHACIRVQYEPGPGGLNMYWLFTHLPYHTRLCILDDPAERRAAALLASEKTPAVSENLLVEDAMDPPAPATSAEQTVTLTFGGDAVLGGRESYYSRSDSFMALVEEKGLAYPFSGLRYMFESDDWTGVNLECALQDTAAGENKGKNWRFRGLPAYVEVLTGSSVEMVNVANNHTGDYGENGYQATLAALRGQVAVCGNGELATATLKGHLFGFGGCRETAYKNDPGVIARDIQALKDLGCEVIVYQCHWGEEYSEHRSFLQEAMARACVRAGADLVIGHHPHVVQGLEIVEGVPVAYSLGNLTFGGTIPLSTYDASLLQVSFSFGNQGVEKSLRLIPVLTSSSAAAGVNDFCPVPAVGEDRLRILTKIQADTPFLLTETIHVY